jgi:hypothetical protein
MYIHSAAANPIQKDQYISGVDDSSSYSSFVALPTRCLAQDHDLPCQPCLLIGTNPIHERIICNLQAQALQLAS